MLQRASRDAMEAQDDSESVKYLVYGEVVATSPCKYPSTGSSLLQDPHQK